MSGYYPADRRPQLSGEAFGDDSDAAKVQQKPFRRSEGHVAELSEYAHGEGNTPSFYVPGETPIGDVDR